MTDAELRQPGVLDLVDDRRDPLLEQPLVEGARRADLELRDDPQAGGLGEPLDRLAGTPARTRISSIGACRSSTSRGWSSWTSAISARVSGSEPGSGPGEERLVRFGSFRSSGSIPGGNVNDGSGLQLAQGKLRFRSTPAAFCRVPFMSPSGLATWTTAHAVSSPGMRSSSRRASKPVSASSPCWVAIE